MSKRSSSEVQDLETSASKKLDEKSSSSSDEEEEDESIDYGGEEFYEEDHFCAAYVEQTCGDGEPGISHRAYFRWLIEQRSLFEQINNHHANHAVHFRENPNSYCPYRKQGIQIGYLHVPATKEEYVGNLAAYLPFVGDHITDEDGTTRPSSFDYGIITGSYNPTQIPEVFKNRPADMLEFSFYDVQLNQLRKSLKMDK